MGVAAEPRAATLADIVKSLAESAPTGTRGATRDHPAAAQGRPADARSADPRAVAPLGYAGGKTIVDDYLREVRPLFDPPRTYQRTIYRPGEICQFDVWEPKAEVPVGHGQTRRGWVVVACLGYSRAGAGALIFSKQTPDLLAGIRRCLWSLAALPETLVWDRQSGLHAGGGGSVRCSV
jgi:hypothetical protein